MHDDWPEEPTPEKMGFITKPLWSSIADKNFNILVTLMKLNYAGTKFRGWLKR